MVALVSGDEIRLIQGGGSGELVIDVDLYFSASDHDSWRESENYRFRITITMEENDGAAYAIF